MDKQEKVEQLKKLEESVRTERQELERELRQEFIQKYLEQIP